MAFPPVIGTSASTRDFNHYQKINKETMPIDVKNEAQKMMLSLISRVQSEEELQELKLLISNYFADKAQREIDDLWKQGVLSQTKLDAICHQH